MKISMLLAVAIASSHLQASYSSFTRSLTMMDRQDIQKALLNCPKIRLRNGMEHPIIGFGTYKVGYLPPSASEAVVKLSSTTRTERSAVECVQDALSIGYRFLECAEFYGNEASIGQAIKNSGIPRQDLFLCSKVWTTTIEKGDTAIRAQVDKTLQDLGTDYLDLCLVHWPVPGHHVAAYKTLLELRDAGKIRGVGISNYAYEDFIELKESVVDRDDWPLVNQIEINPFLFRPKTIAKFEADGVVLQSYRSLRDGKAMDNEVLNTIANEYQRTPAQILGRWCVQHKFIYMPKSVKTERMLENAAIFDFELAKDDMNTLDGLTTDQNLETFQNLYRKCVNRDTSKDGTMDGVKMNITVG